MAGNSIRFTTAMDDGRPTKDPPVTEEGQSGLGGGFYDNSDAKLANKTEDHRLTVAIEGIRLEKYRSVADIDDDKKKVRKGFQSLLSQRQLLDVARADRIVGPRRSSDGDRGTENHILMRRYRTQGGQHLLSSSPRQLFQPTPSMPHPSSKKQDTNKQTIDYNGNHGNQQTTQTPYRRPHTGFHAVRPFTSGGRRRAGTPHSPRGKSPHRAESGGGDISMSSSDKTTTRAKTATGVRQNQFKLDQSSQNQGQNSEGQPKPVQTSTNRNSVDTDDTDTDDDTLKGASRPRSKSAFGIDQISIPTYPIEEEMMNMQFFTGPSMTSRRFSGSMQGRPQTASAAVLHGRSRRELSRLTHIDAITASEMALRRKMWLARHDAKSNVGEAALQQRIQEFITKLDTDKRKREEQNWMMFETEGKREDLVLPAV
ncbi:uncharacterized protein LOC117297005 [Asterias rubens]|uniref:uncharacterized protein LOC117297005 n=1 Tax=Asterias rubens TaxID=7604 RepID=UPI001455D8E5|nr:uncharacterized protein LOC117297005 [Asterias rubens]